MSGDTLTLIAPVLHGLQLAEFELLLFAAFWFAIGAVDELLIDLCWLFLRLRGSIRTRSLPAGIQPPLRRRTAILIPAWREDAVIAATVAHLLTVWRQQNFTLYVGCYRNDPDTIASAMAGSQGDPRLRIVICPQDGPTTKADCLNRLYAAMDADEARGRRPFETVILHDAEDMVHSDALSVIDRQLADADFVQLPVRPELQPGSRWVGGHYADEFAESHGKALLVRSALGAGIPAAGVGCGFDRAMLARLAAIRIAGGERGPFAADCLTEDYELGLLVGRSGGRSRFVRLRDATGELVATRSYFPATLDTSVRQKARWIHGIALQGWERMGWTATPLELWMALRDRRGPLTAIVLAAAYLLVIIEGLLGLASLAGWRHALPVSPLLQLLLGLSLGSLVWRMAFRFAFTAREYGLVEGLRAIMRVPVANIITIMAVRRALAAYISTLAGAELRWDKTMHLVHPVARAPAAA